VFRRCTQGPPSGRRLGTDVLASSNLSPSREQNPGMGLYVGCIIRPLSFDRVWAGPQSSFVGIEIKPTIRVTEGWYYLAGKGDSKQCPLWNSEADFWHSNRSEIKVSLGDQTSWGRSHPQS